MSKENLIFKLDNLEYQIHYLQGTIDNFQPRLPHTSKLYNVKGRKNQKRLQQKLSSLNEKKLLQEINSLKVTILDNKIHNAEKHLTKNFQKAITDDIRKNIESSDTTVDEFINSIIISKLLKLTRGRVMKMVNQRQLDSIPNWYGNHEFEQIWKDKTNKKNPSHVWNELVMKIDGAAKFVSSTMNNGKVKEIISTYENGINVLLGIAIKEAKQLEKKEVIEEESDGEEEVSKSEDDDDEEDDDEENISIEDDLVPDQDIDEETLKQYDTLLADSDGDSETEGGIALDNDINYNEVTDEEPSDDEDGSTEKKYNLPQLMNGYYSGDEEEASDLDEHEEKLVREQTKAPEKKNRRGQRARRRIWAQKYGREANHVQREIEEKKNEREKRQREYEERVEKRAAKQAKLDKVNANLIPIANAKKMGGNYSGSSIGITSKETVHKSVNENHPSWVAKKQAEEKLKNAKFAGKKITFD
ncbi:similar to Saccharomyces cerevisiae YMR014W BUD22 Protein required for 18S rRNA maturation and small ribosomal subunit biogenesis [Maudiozyma saulgeensis]|uniref:Similar to Saccharomyces cerevisiae YMR014W BUD22 Protein required for 18S rRNA maturation and small ribosomal subunit biogenesis n=1 Tax=Maudiozyma saulgeensis TaxID=1789683 RepID=A0A1X7R961_9SACH|nr:similar to Saccharomyces cerevisiae YMR014W BUD22 Protein required for 18S rRNA maturation and small ribosomal subunit biogenesis [Kazachstania saulgeensis]